MQFLRRKRLESILVTDIVGSTAKAVALGDREWSDVVGTHHDLALAHTTERGGRILWTTGDGIVAAFSAPLDAAVTACVLSLEVRRIHLQIRAGVDVGRCRVRRGVPDGPALVGARRASDAADPGAVVVTQALADHVRRAHPAAVAPVEGRGAERLFTLDVFALTE